VRGESLPVVARLDRATQYAVQLVIAGSRLRLRDHPVASRRVMTPFAWNDRRSLFPDPYCAEGAGSGSAEPFSGLETQTSPPKAPTANDTAP